MSTLKHESSRQDREFRRGFESGEIAGGEFDHRSHVRLAYVHLCESSPEEACGSFKRSLLGFLDHLGVDRAKYSETITRAWVKAVWHFMQSSAVKAKSADEFIIANPALLDAKIMLSHYSAELLFSPRARTRFIEPDLEPIPEY